MCLLCKKNCKAQGACNRFFSPAFPASEKKKSKSHPRVFPCILLQGKQKRWLIFIMVKTSVNQFSGPEKPKTPDVYVIFSYLWNRHLQICQQDRKRRELPVATRRLRNVTSLSAFLFSSSSTKPEVDLADNSANMRKLWKEVKDDINARTMGWSDSV